MKKFSSTHKQAQNVDGTRYALVEHEHTQYLEKDANSLVEVSSDIVFTGRLFGAEFSLPSVATIADRDAFDATIRYEGLLLYVEDVQETYQLRGGIDNGSWMSIAGASGSWGSITGSITDQNDLIALLSGYSTVDHTHSIAEVVDLQTELDNKASSVHTHEIGDVNGLETVLTNKTDVGHLHEIGSVDGLVAALDGKASFMHTHVIAEISNLGLFSTTASGLVPETGTSSQSAFLRADGTWEIPTIAAPELVWGGFTGVLADQLDLQTALDSKAANTLFTDLAAGLVPAAINELDTFLRADGTWATPERTVVAWGEITGFVADQLDLASILDTFANSSHTHSMLEITGLTAALDGKVDDAQILTDVPANAVFTDTTYNVFTSSLAGLTPASGGGTTNFLRADGTWDKPTGGEWGQITGTLSAQTDLQTALDGKADSAHTHIISEVTGLQTALDGKVDDSQVLTNVPVSAVFTDTVYDDTAIQAAVALNTAKVSNVDHPLVETAVPVGAVFTDTTYSVVTSTVAGLAPASGGGTLNYLRADGAWAAPEGFPDAPADNSQYARSNNTWVPVEASTTGTFALIDMGSFTAANNATLNAGSFV